MYCILKQNQCISLWFVLLLCFGGFVATGWADTIIAMEYYIDHDPGQGLASSLPPVDGAYDSPLETGEVTIDTTGLKPGPHMVYVRAQKSSGAWGTFPPVLLYINQRTAVIDVEYYIDEDPGLGNGIPLEPVDGWLDYTNEAITATVPIEGLKPGEHTLYIRARNSADIWGPSRSVSFEVLRPITVAGAECGFGRATDMQPMLGTYPMQAEDFAFDSTQETVIKRGIPAPISEGNYRMFIRARDDRNVWSPWFYTDVDVTLSTLASLTKFY